MKTIVFSPDYICNKTFNQVLNLIKNKQDVPMCAYMGLLDIARDYGYEVKLLIDYKIYDFQDLTDKELREGHNFYKIWLAGGFKLK